MVYKGWQIEVHIIKRNCGDQADFQRLRVSLSLRLWTYCVCLNFTLISVLHFNHINIVETFEDTTSYDKNDYTKFQLCRLSTHHIYHRRLLRYTYVVYAVKFEIMFIMGRTVKAPRVYEFSYYNIWFDCGWNSDGVSYAVYDCMNLCSFVRTCQNHFHFTNNVQYRSLFPQTVCKILYIRLVLYLTPYNLFNSVNSWLREWT